MSLIPVQGKSGVVHHGYGDRIVGRRAPSEPLPDVGSHDGSHYRGIPGPLLRVGERDGRGTSAL